MSKNIKILLFELAMIIGKSDFEYPIFIVYLLSRGLSDSETIFFATCTALLKIVDLNMVLCFSGIVLLIVFFTQKIVLKNAETV